jgi:hypothetical protein
MRYRLFLLIMLALIGIDSCSNDTTAPTSCTLGPYTYDSNPSVQRCRAKNGEFAPNACCGR